MNRWFALILLLGCSLTLAEEPALSPTRVFVGQVTDYKGKPVVDAAIEWGEFDHARKWRQVFYTDQDGRYRAETKKVGLDFRLGVSANGFAPQWRDGFIPRRSDREPIAIDFKLELAKSLRGRVVDKLGSPIAGVTVGAESRSPSHYNHGHSPEIGFPFPGLPRQATTDADGNFAIRNLPPTPYVGQHPKNAHKGHSYFLTIHGSRRAIGFSEELNVLTATRAEFVTGDAAMGEIHGVVVDEESGQPIKNFKTVMRFKTEMHSFANDSGEFRMPNLRVDRSHQIFVYAEGYAPLIRNVNPSKDGDVIEFRVAKSASLVGVVTDANGKPIKDAIVLFGLDGHGSRVGYWSDFHKIADGYRNLKTVQRATTGNNGRFAFSQYQPDTDNPKAVLMIKAPGHDRKLITSVEIEQLVRDNQIVIQLDAEAVVIAEALIDGRFDSNVRPHISGAETKEFDGERAYRFGGLSAGWHGVTFPVPHGSGNVMLEKMVDIAAGETVHVKMKYSHGTGCLTGTAPAFSSIQLHPRSAKPNVVPSSIHLRSIKATTDPDGVYKIQGIPAGKYSATCHRARPRRYGNYTVGSSPRVTSDVDIAGETTHNFEFPTIKVPAEFFLEWQRSQGIRFPDQ